MSGVLYQPMLELIEELRRLDFTAGIVTGGGTEFVRQLSRRMYGVEPGMVVGTLIGYGFDRDEGGRPVLRRTISQIGKANERGAKLEHIQSQIGRPPILAAGNSGGDREMLEWAQANRHGGLRDVQTGRVHHRGRRSARVGRRQHAARLGDDLRAARRHPFRMMTA